MSYQFNDTTTYRGLVQMYEKECGFQRGTISGDTDLLKEFTAEVNQALDDFFTIALPASGKWQLDDSNQTDYPILFSAITSGQQDYPLVTDQNGNLILDILKVRILTSATATRYTDIQPVDDPSDSGYEFDSGLTGVPTAYDKLANAIRFNLTPNFTVARGIEWHVNREASYFTYSDTTKKPGVPGLLHKYFYLKPAAAYLRRSGAQNLAQVERELLKLEGDEERGIIGSIARHFGKRARDERQIMSPKLTSKL